MISVFFLRNIKHLFSKSGVSSHIIVKGQHDCGRGHAIANARTESKEY